MAGLNKWCKFKGKLSSCKIWKNIAVLLLIQRSLRAYLFFQENKEMSSTKMLWDTKPKNLLRILILSLTLRWIQIAKLSIEYSNQSNSVMLKSSNLNVRGKDSCIQTALPIFTMRTPSCKTRSSSVVWLKTNLKLFKWQTF
jgi:hypothetical protein